MVVMDRTVEVRIEGRKPVLYTLKVSLGGFVSYPRPVAEYGGILWPLKGAEIMDVVIPHIEITASAAQLWGF